jgi:hypothetical protein
MFFSWYAHRRYSFLLLALMLLFVVYPISGAHVVGRWFPDVLLTLVFVAVFLALFTKKSHRLAAALLGGLAVLANWVGYLVPGLPREPLAIVFNTSAVVFLGFTAVTILLTLHEAEAVTGDSLAAAFTGYLLAGLVFAHLYCIVEALAPGSYKVPPELVADLADVTGCRDVLVYFSFVTLTTVGYGDITPATATARQLAWVEAIVGQFYIAVVMAELIGLKVAQPSDQGPRQGDT